MVAAVKHYLGHTLLIATKEEVLVRFDENACINLVYDSEHERDAAFFSRNDPVGNMSVAMPFQTARVFHFDVNVNGLYHFGKPVLEGWVAITWREFFLRQNKIDENTWALLCRCAEFDSTTSTSGPTISVYAIANSAEIRFEAPMYSFIRYSLGLGYMALKLRYDRDESDEDDGLNLSNACGMEHARRLILQRPQPENHIGRIGRMSMVTAYRMPEGESRITQQIVIDLALDPPKEKKNERPEYQDVEGQSSSSASANPA